GERGVGVVAPEHQLDRLAVEVRVQAVVVAGRLHVGDAQREPVQLQLHVQRLIVGRVPERLGEPEPGVELERAVDVPRVQGDLGRREHAGTLAGRADAGRGHAPARWLWARWGLRSYGRASRTLPG